LPAKATDTHGAAHEAAVEQAARPALNYSAGENDEGRENQWINWNRHRTN
jgi:hypothetical protein